MAKGLELLAVQGCHSRKLLPGKLSRRMFLFGWSFGSIVLPRFLRDRLQNICS